ncbi:helix-turn-helix transcriptional regulator [Clostridium sp. LIBA-8841]|uniref:helix-turn-helix domain-containing protein n=1 Tax=Clostridium sp. LIBA-8841 TaxID=2987530 RepID=UPI002AC483DB|nr:helix-turn-helix transcriptional regulator [Clostridium sp. LIBA-8841]MDZ5255196.1 helix-turn-helix domain-containing protein [Clostridium sp. LIBA-8841]
MVFGEKLLKLRKEKGMSQEALAERLNTSRQAISKWENGQGFPETEKLLMISNFFNVSIDYLLKETKEENIETQKGYYVSKEMIEGFLINANKISKYTSLGISTIIAAYIPYALLKDSFAIIIIAIMVALGFGLIIAASFREEDYKILKRETLIFDENVLKELKSKYNILRKKYIALIITGLGFIIASGTVIFLLESGFNLDGKPSDYYVICAFMISIGAYMVAYFASMMEAYELIVKNDEYVNKFSFKVLKKMREKHGDF